MLFRVLNSSRAGSQNQLPHLICPCTVTYNNKKAIALILQEVSNDTIVSLITS